MFLFLCPLPLQTFGSVWPPPCSADRDQRGAAGVTFACTHGQNICKCVFLVAEQGKFRPPVLVLPEDVKGCCSHGAVGWSISWHGEWLPEPRKRFQPVPFPVKHPPKGETWLYFTYMVTQRTRRYCHVLSLMLLMWIPSKIKWQLYRGSFLQTSVTLQCVGRKISWQHILLRHLDWRDGSWSSTPLTQEASVHLSVN